MVVGVPGNVLNKLSLIFFDFFVSFWLNMPRKWKLFLFEKQRVCFDLRNSCSSFFFTIFCSF